MTLNDVTKNIYVINLKERTDRKLHILKELNKIGCNNFFLIEGIDGNKINNNSKLKNGMFGLVKTYLNIFDEWNKTPQEDILIIEDDCVFVENFNPKLKNYLNNVPNNWDMLYFGANHNYHIGMKTQDINNKCIKLNNSYSAHCILLKNYVFIDLINNIKNFSIENDVMLANLQKKYNAYSSKEPLTSQLQSYSNIENKFVNYDWLIK
jgi:GR25 family glycosyltransferase involved in LPS biosynthesis